jgi:hypothetical protein
VPESLIVQDPHQAGLAAPRQNAVLLEQGGKPIEDGQSLAGQSAHATRVRPRSRRHAFRIDADAFPSQSFDVGQSCDPVGPARDGSA